MEKPSPRGGHGQRTRFSSAIVRHNPEQTHFFLWHSPTRSIVEVDGPRQIKDQMMSGAYIQVDETPIKYLDPGNGKTGQGYLWVAHRPGADVLFEWYTTREAKCLDNLIPLDFSGTIQCDGYSAYVRFARHRASVGRPVRLAGCWAHARRGFYEALDHAAKEAAWILIQIGYLYEIERRLRRHGIESYTYLHDVLTRLPSMTNRQIKDVVPKAWAAARKSTALRAA